MPTWLLRLIGDDPSVLRFDRIRAASVDAYDLVDELPRGSARVAAWNAYVVRTYADKLLLACSAGEYVSPDTESIVFELYELAARWVEQAREPTPAELLQPPLPHWHTPIRSQEQLVGMRETLDVLRVFLTHDLDSFHGTDPLTTKLRERLAAINAKVDTVDGLWLPRATDELRGGIGDALADGLDLAYALGQSLAQETAPP